MRKTNKIVSLILVLALLLGVFVVLPVTPVVANAAAEEFKPTMTETAKPSTDYVKSETAADVETDNRTSYIQISSNITDKTATYYMVTDTATGNKYLDIRPGASFSTEPDGYDANNNPTWEHTHWNWITKDTYYTAGTYFIVEFDTYAESEIIKDLYIGVTSRNSAGDNKGGTSTNIKDWNLPVGEWAHVTFIGDVDTNILYVYVNGNLAYTRTNGVANTNDTVAGNFYGQGIRVNIAGRSNMTANQNFAIDNVKYTYNVESAWLDSNVGAASILDSGLYNASYTLPNIPTLAKVDGKLVASVPQLNAALVSHKVVNVELLRSYLGTITVNCDAIVKTNGYKVPTAGSNVTVSANGETYSYDAPWKETLTVSKDSSTTSGIKSDIAGNLVSGSASFGNWNNAAVSYNTVTTIDGEVYGQLLANANKTTGNHYVSVDVTKQTLDFDGYYVIEFDVATDDVALENVAIVPVITWSGSTSYTDRLDKGTGVRLASLDISDGAWHHVAFVSDLATITSYIYVDGVLFGTYANSAYDASHKVEDREYWLSNFRINMEANTAIEQGSSLSFDNLCVRTYSAKGDSYVFETAPVNKHLPVLATVNGEDVYNTNELSAKLVDNGVKNVELFHAYNSPVTVNSDAIIETHGFTAPVAGANVTVTSDGTLYTYDAPYAESLAMSDAVLNYQSGGLVDVAKADVANNLFNQMQWDSTMNGKVNNCTSEAHPGTGLNALGYIGTNTINGDKFIIYDGSITNEDGLGITGCSNSYYEYQSMTKITYDASKAQYMVYDFDFVQMTEGTVAFSLVPRNEKNSGLWGGNSINISSAVAGYDTGDFLHLTYVFDMNNNYVYAYVNGNLAKSVKNGVTSDSHFNSYKTAATNYAYINMNGVRVGSNSTAVFATGNVAIRHITETAGTTDANSLTAAITGTNLGVWSDAVTETALEMAPIASVDGEYIGSALALSDALIGRNAKKVEILRSDVTPITVSCDAVINTNGLNVTLNPASNVTVTTNGDVMTFDGPWAPSATETTVSNGNFIIANTIPGNLFTGNSGIKFQNNGDGKMAMYEVTDTVTGNTYLKLTPTVSGTTGANIYLTTEIIPSGDSSMGFVLKDGEGYYVYDLDIAADAKIISALDFSPVARNNASEASTFPFPSEFNLGTFGDSATAGEWLHLTVVGDMAANKQYVYVNGEFAFEAGQANTKPGEYDYLNVKGFRIDLSETALISTDESFLIDNISCRVYKSAGVSGGLDTALASGSLTGWANYVSANGGERLPAIATVNGVEYSALKTLEAALATGRNLNVTIDRPVSGIVNVNATATITTNGVENFFRAGAGYNIFDNGDGTLSIVVESRYGTIVINVNGEEAVRATIAYGTDIVKYLKENNSYVAGANGNGAIATDNSVVYYQLTWDNTPTGTVSGDATYNVTGTRFDYECLVLESDGRVNETTGTFENNLGWDHKRDITIILNKDVTIGGQAAPICTGYTKTVYLNGHTFRANKNDTNAHMMSVKNDSKIVFIGGNVVDDMRTLTQAVVYADYSFSGEVKFLNCNLYTVANVATMRGGTFTAEDCNITILETQGSNAFQLAEYYNAGYTYNKVTLNLIDSDVRFTHASEGRTASLITIKDISAWGKDPSDAKYQEAVNKGADKLVHEINIYGTTICCDFTAAVLNSTTNNVNFTITNSQINAKVLFASAKGNIVVGRGVYSAVPISEDYIAEGLVQVKSGNPVAPYLYTDDYGTVVWADGTTERWANGTYPTNAKYNKANVPMVAAGQTYNIGDNTDLAIAMKANLSLSANLKLNVYVPTSTDLRAISICGVIYDIYAAPVVEINGDEYYYFGYEIAPHFATGDFTVVATVGDVTIAKAIDLIEYADLVAAQYKDDAAAVNLAKAVLTYVSAAAKHMGAYTQGYDASVAYADAAAIAVDTSSAVNTMANVNSYITAAALDLNAAPAWVFYVANGADISDLVIKVNGRAVNYNVVGNTVVVELRAYDMLETLTVEVGGVSAQYNFAAYYTAIKATNDAFTWPGNWQAGDNNDGAIAYHSMQLLDAFYSYAVYAAAVQ